MSTFAIAKQFRAIINQYCAAHPNVVVGRAYCSTYKDGSARVKIFDMPTHHEELWGLLTLKADELNCFSHKKLTTPSEYRSIHSFIALFNVSAVEAADKLPTPKRVQTKCVQVEASPVPAKPKKDTSPIVTIEPRYASYHVQHVGLGKVDVDYEATCLPGRGTNITQVAITRIEEFLKENGAKISGRMVIRFTMRREATKAEKKIQAAQKARAAAQKQKNHERRIAMTRKEYKEAQKLVVVCERKLAIALQKKAQSQTPHK